MHTFGSIVLEILRKSLKEMDTLVIIIVGLALTLLIANRVDKK